MYQQNMCGAGQCDPADFNWSKEDRKAFLIEKKAILEAKLATVTHWIESVDKEEESKSEEK